MLMFFLPNDFIIGAHFSQHYFGLKVSSSEHELGSLLLQRAHEVEKVVVDKQIHLVR